jgi:hypothetical protein
MPDIPSLEWMQKEIRTLQEHGRRQDKEIANLKALELAHQEILAEMAKTVPGVADVVRRQGEFYKKHRAQQIPGPDA